MSVHHRECSNVYQTNSEPLIYSSSQSSMSSESCPSFSRLSFDESNIINISQQNLMLKPHRSSDSTCQAIRSATFRRSTAGSGGLGFRDFSLVRQIGSGDIGKVYLCRLRSDESCCFAMKVVNKQVLALKKKIERAETERKILKLLDHPFLPTLHAQFEASHFSCVVMEYCPGGDLHSLRHKQPNKRFSINSARYTYLTEFFRFLKYTTIINYLV